MRVPSHPSADKELEEAAFYYESCSVGLGDKFLENTKPAVLPTPKQVISICLDERILQ